MGGFADGSPTGGSLIQAILDVAGGDSTLTGLDRIVASGPNNTLSIAVVDEDAVLPIFNMSGVQTVNIRAAAGIGQDVADDLDFSKSSITGLANVNVTEAYGNVALTVSGATAVNVSGLDTGNAVDVTADTGAVTVTSTGYVAIDGGSTQTVKNEGGSYLSGATGNVSVTDADLNNSDVEILDGANVTVNATYDADTFGGWSNNQVAIGLEADDWNAAGEATGAVNVTVNAAGDKGNDTWVGNIVTYGGTTVDITVNATQAINAATDGGATNYTIDQNYIAAFGTADTTSVTVTQTEAVADKDSKNAIAKKAEVDALTFKALTAGQTTIVGGLTFTASESLTAAQVAAAFANLADGATNGSSTKGVYSGSLTGWSSGAVSTATVNFTSTAKSGTDIAYDSGDVDPTFSQITNGAAGQDAIAGVGGVDTGFVDVMGWDKVASDYVSAVAIESVTLTNFDGAAIISDVLSDVALTNGSSYDIQIDSGLTALNLTIDTVDGSDIYINGDYWNYVAGDGPGAVETLNLSVTGDSSVSIDDYSDTLITALNIRGSAELDMTGSSLEVLEAVTIAGAVSVIAGNSFLVDSVTSFASTSTGDISAEINGRYATVTTGSGDDDISLYTDSRYLKNVSLGGGDDTLTLVNDTGSEFTKYIIGTGVTLDGGSGSNTLIMDAYDLDNFASVDTTKIFASRLNNFDKLELTDNYATRFEDITVNLKYLVNSSTAVSLNDYVITNYIDDQITIDNLASGGTIEARDYTDDLYINVVDASTKDVSLNINLKGDSDYWFYTDGVETVSITSSNTSKTDVDYNDVYLYDSLDELSTVTIDGDADLELDTAYNTSSSLTLIDASELTGALIYSTDGDVSVEVIGGSGDDLLYAYGDGDILRGNDGDDEIESYADGVLLDGGDGDDYLYNDGYDAVEMSGGAGSDIFEVDWTNSISADVATVINDLEAGDYLAFYGTSFDSTAKDVNESDYINTVIDDLLNTTDVGDAVWFYYNGDTYLVADDGGNDSYIFHIIGQVDLSNSTFNSTAGYGLLLIG